MSRWDDEGYPYAGRDLLLVTFPEAAGRWTVEELWRMYELHIMVETARFAPETVVAMLRLLLHTARDSLGNPEAAEVLLDEDMMALFENERVTAALLRALKEDDDLARLICQSNYVGYYHEELIKACNGAREPELRRRLLDLLAENPYGRAELEIEPYPEEPPVEELPPVVRKKAKLPQVAAGEQIYDYCMVRVKDSGRDLAYLTGRAFPASGRLGGSALGAASFDPAGTGDFRGALPAELCSLAAGTYENGGTDRAAAMIIQCRELRAKTPLGTGWFQGAFSCRRACSCKDARITAFRCLPDPGGGGTAGSACRNSGKRPGNPAGFRRLRRKCTDQSGGEILHGGVSPAPNRGVFGEIGPEQGLRRFGQGCAPGGVGGDHAVPAIDAEKVLRHHKQAGGYGPAAPCLLFLLCIQLESGMAVLGNAEILKAVFALLGVLHGLPVGFFPGGLLRQEGADLFLHGAVAQGKILAEGVWINEFFVSVGKADGEHILVQTGYNTLSESFVADCLSD